MDTPPHGALPRAFRYERVGAFFALGIVAMFVLVLLFLLFGGAGSAAGHGAGAGHAPPVGNESLQSSTHSGNMSGEAHRMAGFVGSFGFMGLATSLGYVTALCVWAGLRRDWIFLVRHIGSATAMLLLAVLYLNARGSLAYNGHNWNRSFADASVVLYAVTLAIGPLARLWRPASAALGWRRETGIWGTIAAAVHVGIFWEWSLGWDWRRFFYPGDHGATSDTLFGDASGAPSAFNLANVVGLVALAYALVLAVTSNDASQRWLKSGWSWLQDRSTTMWLLVLLHTWMFAYYITHEQILPPGTLWASFWMVLLLQSLAFAKTVWLRRAAKHGSVAAPAS